MPGVFGAICNNSRLAEDFTEIIDTTRGNRVITFNNGKIVVGFQNFYNGGSNTISIESNSSLLIYHGSIALDNNCLEHFFKNILIRWRRRASRLHGYITA
ncbi:MAG: hypothetical protein QW291_08090 [Thermofilaceae archaeon]